MEIQIKNGDTGYTTDKMVTEWPYPMHLTHGVPSPLKGVGTRALARSINNGNHRKCGVSIGNIMGIYGDVMRIKLQWENSYFNWD